MEEAELQEISVITAEKRRGNSVMKKNIVRKYLILAILFVVYTIIVFIPPFQKNKVVITAYIFSIIAILFQVLVSWIAFTNGTDIKSRFYAFPVINIGRIYLIVQIIASGIFMVLSLWIHFWLVIVVESIILALAVIGLVTTDAIRDEVVHQDEKIKSNISVMKTLQIQASSLIVQCKDGAVQKQIRAFAEELKYSDPVSSEVTSSIEQNLSTIMIQLYEAIAENNQNRSASLCETARNLLAERNRLCKLNK